MDYFRWRQADSMRNSINAYCYWTLRKHGKNERQATKALEKIPLEEKYLLLRSHGINYKEIPSWQRYGVAVMWKTVEKEGFNPITKEAVVTKRRLLAEELNLPKQEDYQKFIENFICE